ncbi:DUF7288 family protein [Halocalculus aciditolerans]|uniref:Uncharacterized protein n=1 Tax=Halocalculus aciditolerans TaxID=1383812 RepID=A0A830FBK1_9EURY|nr:hypothetical protein [Halocalculus aciditolerans]GGL58724.1 hypothetical protein GCM10009039_16210 [Halocalculus aciditolerans]
MTRGQAHTLEGVAAALLVVMSVLFAIQMTAVTPLTGSTANQHIENQEEAVARGVLAVTAENDSLRPAVLRWDTETNRFPNTSRGEPYYGSNSSSTELEDTLKATFSGNGIAFNVNFYYVTPSGERRQERFYYTGAPTSNAVTASRSVTLYDDDRLYDDGWTAATVSSARYFAPDAAPNSHLYNVVDVEVVVWRM